jgi:hypothetical protein
MIQVQQGSKANSSAQSRPHLPRCTHHIPRSDSPSPSRPLVCPTYRGRLQFRSGVGGLAARPRFLARPGGQSFRPGNQVRMSIEQLLRESRSVA